MNDNERRLLRAIVENKRNEALAYTRIILTNITSQKDQVFKENLLRMLDAKKDNLIELPYNLQDLLIAENTENFPMGKFMLRDGEKEIAERIISTYNASQRLMELGIPYLPAAILHGVSGTGKTELARYIAHKAKLPFIYVRFSSLVNSSLGATQSNVGKVFGYAKSSPCLLCFDEIDAIAMKRGDRNDVSEMSRVVIALMQEMDQLPNNVIIIGTTNRFDRLDPALVRRFPIQYEVKEFAYKDAMDLARKFFGYVGYDMKPVKLAKWCEENLESTTPASTVVTKCTNYIVDWIMEGPDAKE